MKAPCPLLLLLLSRFAPAAAQDLPVIFEHLTIDHGLSQNGVSCIMQDSRGFMWFGTLGGLNKYDGHHFRVFTHSPFDTLTLSDNAVFCLLETRDGMFWIGTAAGLDRFDPLSETFIPCRGLFVDSAGRAATAVTALCEDRRGVLWIGTSAGLHGLDRKTGKITRFVHHPEDPASIASGAILALHEDRKGVLWIGTDGGGLDRWNGDASGFRHFRHDPGNSRSLGADNVRAIAEDSSGAIWIGTSHGGLGRFDPEREEFFNHQWDSTDPNRLTASDIWAIVPAAGKDGGLWVGTGKGLNLLLPSGRSQFTCRRFVHDLADDGTLSGNEVWSLCVDRAGVLWVGTWQDGLNKLAPYRIKFGCVGGSRHGSSGFDDPNVTSVHEDLQGKVWVGTLRGGLACFDRERKRVAQYPNIPRNPRDPSGRRHRLVSAIDEDTRRSTLWIGTWSGIVRLDPGRRSFKQYYHRAEDPSSVALDEVNTLLIDSKDRLWVGLRGGGLDRLDLHDAREAFRHYRHQRSNAGSLCSDWVWTLFEDSKGRIWVGTDRGVSMYDDPADRFASFLHSQNDRKSLCDNNVFTITEDAEHSLWMGTSAGLDRLDEATGTFVHYAKGDGLPSPYVYGLLADADGYLWVSTNRGLARFGERESVGAKSRNYDVRDGLQSNEFGLGAYHRGASGMFYFGGVNGLNYFRPSEVKENPVMPQVAITAIEVVGGNEAAREIPVQTPLVMFPYTENVFAVEFAALDYTDPARNTYAHRLEGFDRDWIFSGSQYRATYSNLDPGTYTLRVRGANSDGVWNTAGVSLSIVIQPPFWKTWPFRIGAGVAVAILLFGLYHVRVNRLLEIERMRVRIASDLHDDIGSTLTKIAVQSEVIQSSTDPDKVRATSQQIGAASRQIIGTLSDIVWSIDARNDTMGDLLDRMRDFVAEVLAPRHVEVHVSHEGLDPKKTVPVEIRQNLYLIFKETINNIARHSNARNVRVLLSHVDRRFVMTISDDGEAGEGGTYRAGQGVRNMKLRAERIQADLKITGPPGVKMQLSMREF